MNNERKEAPKTQAIKQPREVPFILLGLFSITLAAMIAGASPIMWLFAAGLFIYGAGCGAASHEQAHKRQELRRKLNEGKEL